MGHTKRKTVKPPSQLRARTTRSRGKALPDPEENSQQLNEQLRMMGLYAAPTLGDGNCLFRALSDQLYGTASFHTKLRQDICNWIEAYKDRYAPFVDDERGLDVHLQCMRQPATYGGHLELSACAHLMRRDIKVVQPGLVYVIEWSALAMGDEDERHASSSSVPPQDDSALSKRDKRRLAQGKRPEPEKPAPPPVQDEDDEAPGPIYVAYHDWEHFSSIRSLRGPHTGLPNVQESPAPAGAPTPPKKPPSKAKASPKPTIKRAPRKADINTADPSSSRPRSPSEIPLPGSRSSSPLSSAPPSHSSTPFPSTPAPALDPGMLRAYRSPKRTFDESSASSQAHSEASAKRAKSASRAPLSRDSTRSMREDGPADIDIDGPGDGDTPDLSASASSPASSSSLSSVPSPEATPPPESQEPPPSQTDERRLTQRQRKALGLPKQRPALVGSTAAARRTAGKIVIPGGRFRRAQQQREEASTEWEQNGTGRVDVRGFRELKI